MSAVDEYRKQRDMCADDDRKDPDIAVLADAAIAELEAEARKCFATVADLMEQRNKVEAELGKLNSRSCETCEHAEGCDIFAAGHADAAFTYCSVWEEWHLRYGAERGTG